MAMKLGTENKKQVAVAAALGVVVLVLVVYTLVSNLSSGPTLPPANAAIPPAVPSTPVSRTASPPAAKVARLNSNLDPTLHYEIMRQAETLEYTGRGRNIFSAQSAPLVSIPKPIRSPRPPVNVVNNVPQGPPPPPVIDLKFFGYSAQQSGVRKAFLLHGDDVFIAAEGEVVDHRYRVIKISPFSVQMEDLPYHNTQTISLTAN